MGEGELYGILDNIPSDCESIITDGEDDGENESPLDFDMNELDVIVEGVRIIDAFNNENEWDVEDEFPLSQLRRQILGDNIIWTQNSSHVTRVIEFSGQSVVNVPDTVETPVNMFLHLFPEQFINNITFQTNLYAMQKKGGQHSYVPATAEEIKDFLGINILMSLKQMPSYKDYWSSHVEMRDVYISSVMSRDRFSWFLHNLHLVDNSVEPKKGQANYDKLYKIRPLLDTLGKTFLDSLTPSEYQAIDESMIKFKGRISFLQYMPMKPAKRGYKIWTRADKQDTRVWAKEI